MCETDISMCVVLTGVYRKDIGDDMSSSHLRGGSSGLDKGRGTGLKLRSTPWLIKFRKLDLSCYNGQNERTSQTLEIILRVYVLGVGDSWDTYLPLAGFCASLAIMPVGQRELGSTEIVRKTKESIEMIQERLWTAQRRQKKKAVPTSKGRV
ncbi:hypothetical protein OSB04_019758 [Centaurea solstitialis]|uniref:Uncharacterized protein n=1 Tax=Centaurea solstitialis TaxID=347529 RepID=A0AA38SQX7_9ASTR|nr:hypothetical protein OSB04_019758 [Centaurea solstitialis]